MADMRRSGQLAIFNRAYKLRRDAAAAKGEDFMAYTTALGRASKQELKDRLMAAMDHFNQDPVVHTRSYKLDRAA